MKRTVQVTQWVEVEVDESKFTEDFYKEFNRYIFDFGTDISRHIGHLGQLYIRGVVDEYTNFIEGYGEVKDFGIKFKFEECDIEVCTSDHNSL